MAVLNEAERAEAWMEHMRQNLSQYGSLSKMDLRAFIDAVDAWCESNATSFNNALPQPARSALTQKQKALGFMLVVSKRYGVTI